LPFFSLAQDRDLDQNKNLLELSNKYASGVERLKFLDSLSSEIRYDSAFNADSVFRVTISYAQQLDSINLAIKHATNFINYLNYGSNDYDQAKQIIRATQRIVPRVTKPN